LKDRTIAIIGVSIFLMVAFAAFKTDDIQRSEISDEKKNYSLSSEFKSSWFDGKAELASYDLRKARYGEIREGEAAMIFVTEPFLPEQQVKYEGYDSDEKPKTVLKLNFHQTFNTGVYPYSILSSVFSPLNPYENALKISTSTQEWCGHTFIQMNKRDRQYEVTSLSYFQKESDRNYEIDQTLTEDEIWTKIRISPTDLPQGNIKIIPGTSISRLNHFDLKPFDATAKLVKGVNENIYSLKYNDLERSLAITFESKSPYRILGWSETTMDGGKSLTTTGKLKESIDLDYWNKKSVADSSYRALLRLK
jgi:hypothetical protein